ncbi:hypothetical protein IE077_001750 [Cardiosporidium cionae]|uniref:Aprataxin C2HE/C2H2/C2HC zinc finger domain-containing protein n=1 Tax=Cardiosporidium cionae TaxID=476202 RepID=A0ABQ7JCC1_9APIC|nr:hypothetical protein IE077_001750 [Cardiosporidium cionae]|eukprot:KAF8821667.1 hypothetical protein IE077_001750 [Cardiosporidium cionae]
MYDQQNVMQLPVYSPPTVGYKGPWRNALYHLLEHREGETKPYVYHQWEEFITLYDGFPKATYHLLVFMVMKDQGQTIKGPKYLTEAHSTLLRKLQFYVRCIAKNLQIHDGKDVVFRCGIHAIPSLEPLHFHLISQDFQARGLKSVKHWNSFNTPFFVPLYRIIQLVEHDNTLISLDQAFNGTKMASKKKSETMLCSNMDFTENTFLPFLKNSLKCNKCDKDFRNIIHKLKEHLELCLSKTACEDAL